MKQKFAVNGELKIEYLHVNEYAVGIPFVIIPGAVVSANEFYEDVKDSLKENSVIISLRGLGGSSVPESGYTAEDFVSDIESVVTDVGFEMPCLIGHSAGAGLAAAYAVRHPSKVKALVFADYPPGIPVYNSEWAERVASQRPGIDKRFIDGIVRDSVKHFFAEGLKKSKIPVLFLKADGDDSILPEVFLEKLRELMPEAIIETIPNCGHDIFGEKGDAAFHTIDQFMAKLD